MKKTIGVEYKGGACDSPWPPHTKSPPKQVLLVNVMDVLPPVGNHFLLVTFHVLGAGRVYVAICQVM